jgi:hypothetical protein
MATLRRLVEPSCFKKWLPGGFMDDEAFGVVKETDMIVPE